jgi:MFS transporter, DHA1 family, tetracycline resistance protein
MIRPRTATRCANAVPIEAGKHAVTFIFITVLIDMVGFGLIFPVLPALIQDVGEVSIANATVIGGWMFVSYTGMQFVMGPTIGNLSDRFGRRPLLLLSLAGLGVDYLLSAFAPNLLWLFIGRLFAGICGASYNTANAYIADVTPPEGRARAFGMMGAAFGLGFVLGPAIGGLLGEYGPRVPFLAAAALSLANLTYGYFVLPETLPATARRSFEWRRANPFGALKVFGTYKTVLPYCAVLFLYMFGVSVYPAVWAFWGVARFGWSATTIGLTLACFGLVTAIAQGLLTGPAMQRLGARGTVILALCVGSVCATGFGLAPSLTFVLMLALINAPEGLVDPALTATMSHEAPANAQGELQGGIASAKNLAFLLGTPVFAIAFGYMVENRSAVAASQTAYWGAAAIMVAALALFLQVSRRKSAYAGE